MLIKKMMCPENKWNIKCPYEMNPEFITVHNTANDASAIAEVSYMIGNGNKTSFHVAIDDTMVVEAIRFDRNAWHAGDGKGNGNMKSIGIEICYSKSGGERFDAAENLAASYIAMLLKQYGWGIERVKKHQDWSGKYCPHRTLDLGWERFLNKIREHLNIQAQPIENKNIDNGGNLEMAKVYQNGSTPEPVFSDTALTKKIGSLNPREKAEYLSIDNDRPLVRYKVNGTNTFKCGYVRWKGGCK